MVKKIPLTRGKFALVDDADYTELSRVKWQCRPNHNTGVDYASRSVMLEGRVSTITMHRVIMNAKRGRMIDHIDGDGLNNVRANLRFANKSQNARNAKPRTTFGGKPKSSPYKGVRLNKKSGTWMAGICVDGRRIHLGCFANECDAAGAYDTAARRYFGRFARTNLLEGLEQNVS